MPLLEDCAEDPGRIRHDPVDPEVEQPAHLAGVVHGPDVHGKAECVGASEECRFHERDAQGTHGHLHAGDVGERPRSAGMS